MKFSEDKYLIELENYIKATYNQHYAKDDRIQVTEYIMSISDNFEWLKGNVIKYVARYGVKEGFNRKDVLKTLHYALLMLYYHDRRVEKGQVQVPSDGFDHPGECPIEPNLHEKFTNKFIDHEQPDYLSSKTIRPIMPIGRPINVVAQNDNMPKRTR